MDLDNIHLPKTNPRKLDSKMKQTSLRIAIYDIIKKVEEENNYKFEPYEVDNVLLELVKRNQESYLNTKFGYDMV